jgi:sterol desaturase/sphingolipid hydroxylase (fatty acid hydroxylase superfamily)
MWKGFLERLDTELLSYDAAVALCAWITALAGTAITYLVQIDAPQKSLRGFLKFCFPSVILHHRSCRLDIVFVTIMRFLHMPAIVMITNVAVAELSYSLLTSLFGTKPQNPEPLWLWAIIFVTVVIVEDFATFYVHYLEHRIGVLWELHKVHHSTEFLLPLSNRRFHPLQAIIDNFGNMVATGLILGITSYVFSLPIHDNSLIGLDGLFVLNMLSFYQLRHSHVPMRYGWLERHLISPAQHQIHHSREERHWDRNFGLCLSWWDRWFGTIVYSTPGEQFALGLPKDIQDDYDSVLKLFFTPVRNIALIAWRGGRRLLLQEKSARTDAATGRA